MVLPLATPAEESFVKLNASTDPPLTHEVAPNPVFFDKDGLRAIWRVAIYAVLYYVLRSGFSAVMGAFARPDGSLSLWAFLWSEVLLFVAALAPALVLWRLEDRDFSSYGLPLQQAFGKNFWIGALWGITAISVLLLAMRGVGVFSFGHIALHGVRVLKFAAFWGVLFLVVGLYEDFLFRGYSQFTLTQAIGFWPAAILLCLVFGAVHLPQEKSALGNQGEAWIGALGAALIGFFFCLTLRRTGTLWFAIGMHTAWDWGETFLYSVPDSGMVAPGHLMNPSFHGSRWLTGGSVGPEASVLLFVLIAAMWVLFDRMYPTKRGMQKSEVRMQE